MHSAFATDSDVALATFLRARSDPLDWIGRQDGIVRSDLVSGAFQRCACTRVMGMLL
jgi:hypothetical protein